MRGEKTIWTLLFGVCLPISLQSTTVFAADSQSTKSSITIFDVARFGVSTGKLRKTAMVGSSFAKTPFEETPSQGALLIGFDVGLGTIAGQGEAIYALRPVYETKTNRIYYRGFGTFQDERLPSGYLKRTNVNRIIRVRAKPGYAVGAIRLRSARSLRGMKISFMRIDGWRLDPQQSYTTGWIGSGTFGEVELISGSGAPIVGVFGNMVYEKVMGLGLVYLQKSVFAPPKREKPEADKPIIEKTVQSKPPDSAPVHAVKAVSPAEPDKLAEPDKQDKPVLSKTAASKKNDFATNDVRNVMGWGLAVFLGSIGVVAALVLFVAFGRDNSSLDNMGANVTEMDPKSAAANVLDFGGNPNTQFDGEYFGQEPPRRI